MACLRRRSTRPTWGAFLGWRLSGLDLILRTRSVRLRYRPMVSDERLSSCRLVAELDEVSASLRERSCSMRSWFRFRSISSIPRSMSRHSFRMALGSPWPKEPAFCARDDISTGLAAREWPRVRQRFFSPLLHGVRHSISGDGTHSRSRFDPSRAGYSERRPQLPALVLGRRPLVAELVVRELSTPLHLQDCSARQRGFACLRTCSQETIRQQIWGARGEVYVEVRRSGVGRKEEDTNPY
ncbi:hypothetical protein VTK73DRAFT_3172 [Phialemonium thermophilum]|uniref:Uncharacterized protein n=1 Tax=Phialemonium thermophilum TaxID=223376 RepID=A0ABR3VLG3_9PEZI